MNTRLVLPLLMLGAASSILEPRAQAGSVSVNPTADAFVTTGPTGNLSATNFGGAGSLSIAAPGSAKGEFQTVLQFDLSTVKSSYDTQYGAGQWGVQSATLQFTATTPNNAIFNASTAGQFDLSLMQNNSWTEGTGTPSAETATGITFSSLPSFEGASDEALGTFSFGGTTSGNAVYTLSLGASFMNDILAGGIVSIRAYAADTSVSYLLDSRSFSTTADHPLLTITAAVPEPGSLALAGLGAAVWLGRRLAVRRGRG